MNKILVINCGSSSLKFKLFDDRGEAVIAQGLVERISQQESPIKIKYEEQAAKFATLLFLIIRLRCNLFSIN